MYRLLFNVDKVRGWCTRRGSYLGHPCLMILASLHPSLQLKWGVHGISTTVCVVNDCSSRIQFTILGTFFLENSINLLIDFLLPFGRVLFFQRQSVNICLAPHKYECTKIMGDSPLLIDLRLEFRKYY